MTEQIGMSNAQIFEKIFLLGMGTAVLANKDGKKFTKFIHTVPKSTGHEHELLDQLLEEGQKEMQKVKGKVHLDVIKAISKL